MNTQRIHSMPLVQMKSIQAGTTIVGEIGGKAESAIAFADIFSQIASSESLLQAQTLNIASADFVSADTDSTWPEIMSNDMAHEILTEIEMMAVPIDMKVTEEMLLVSEQSNPLLLQWLVKVNDWLVEQGGAEDIKEISAQLQGVLSLLKAESQPLTSERIIEAIRSFADSLPMKTGNQNIQHLVQQLHTLASEAEQLQRTGDDHSVNRFVLPSTIGAQETVKQTDHNRSVRTPDPSFSGNEGLPAANQIKNIANDGRQQLQALEQRFGMIHKSHLTSSMQGDQPVLNMDKQADETLPLVPLSVQEGIRFEQAVSAKSAKVDSQQFVQEMSKTLLKDMQITSRNGISEANITLMPEHLGKVNVRLALSNGQLVAQFTAETLLGKELLDQQLPQLRTALQSQGLHVEKLEVAHSSNSSSSGSQQQFFDQRQQPQRQSFSQNKQSNKLDRYGIDTAVLDDMEINKIAGIKHTYGSSFDVSA